MAWCATIVGLVCPFFIERSKHEIPYHVRMYNYIDSLCKDPKYVGIRGFMASDFKNRKRERLYHILWEYPFIGLLNTFLGLVTKYHPLELLIISLVIYKALIGGWYLGFVVYYGLVLLLTGLVYFPPVANHIKYMYGPDCFKKLGWNMFGLKQNQTGKSTGQVLGGTLGGGFIFFKTDQYIAIQVRNQENANLPIVEAQMIDRWNQNGRHGSIPQFSPEEVEHLFRKNQHDKSHYFMLKEKYPDLDLGEVPKISQKEMEHGENPENFRPFQVIKGLFPDSAGPIFDRVWDVIQARAWKK
jgi:hypothetical protein